MAHCLASWTSRRSIHMVQTRSCSKSHAHASAASHSTDCHNCWAAPRDSLQIEAQTLGTMASQHCAKSRCRRHSAPRCTATYMHVAMHPWRVSIARLQDLAHAMAQLILHLKVLDHGRVQRVWQPALLAELVHASHPLLVQLSLWVPAWQGTPESGSRPAQQKNACGKQQGSSLPAAAP